MFCSKCGSKIEDNTAFCPYCGNKINDSKNSKDKEKQEKLSTQDPTQRSLHILLPELLAIYIHKGIMLMIQRTAPLL